MKIQLRGQSLRIRLSEAEVVDLLAHGRCDDATSLAGVGRWQRRLALGEAAQPAFSRNEDLWQLTVCRESFAAFVATRPRRDGLRCELAGALPGVPLQISIEVDVRDSSRRRTARIGADSAHALRVE